MILTTVVLTVMKVKIKTPLAAGLLFLLFFALVGLWYLGTNLRRTWRRFCRWWRRVTGRPHFWGYVFSVVLFGGFALYYVWLTMTRT